MKSTTTKASHTPTPWTLMPGDSAPRITIDGDKEWPIVPVISGPSKAHARANAAFIVKAVNCHEELLEALKLAYAALRNPSERHQSKDERGLTQTITEAIAASEGI